MDIHDDELRKFEAAGAAPVPVSNDQGFIQNEGARIWFSTYGSGSPMILVQGGLGYSGKRGYQVQKLVESGYRAVLIDSRGRRSGRDGHLSILMAAMVGGSAGACTH